MPNGGINIPKLLMYMLLTASLCIPLQSHAQHMAIQPSDYIA